MSYYVSMIDNFMSGWGPATDKINIYLVECDTIEQADQIERAAERRDEMSKIAVHQDEPYYPSHSHLVSEKHYSDLGGVWHDQ